MLRRRKELTGGGGCRYAAVPEGKGKAPMILAPLFGTAMVIAVATGPLDDPMGVTHFSPREKSSATESLVRSATDCIVHAVFADPHYTASDTSKLGDLIVASMPSCVVSVRAMIDGYDQYYGEGTGEDFFMGPYLDALPKMIVEAAKKAAAP
jgi:hypothetical protein